MPGLALEGGGAKGSYHMGVYRAYMEKNRRFRGVVGTSIGALNGAMIAQGDWETAYRLWEDVTYSRLFDITPDEAELILEKGTKKEQLRFFAAKLAGILNNVGVDTRKIHALLTEMINEERLRKTKTDYGLVTVNVSSLKPMELFLEQIPPGKLVDYLMASASFPGLKTARINQMRFLDGGLYDNCPLNMLQTRGYAHALAVHTYGLGRRRRLREQGMKVTDIWPSDSTGPLFAFTREQAAHNLTMGYYDGLRLLEGLGGTKYYVTLPAEEEVLALLLQMPGSRICAACKTLGLSPTENRRVLFEHWLPGLAAQLELPTETGYSPLLLAALEDRAERAEIPRFVIYSFWDFYRLVKNAKPAPKKHSMLSGSSTSDLLIEALPVK